MIPLRSLSQAAALAAVSVLASGCYTQLSSADPAPRAADDRAADRYTVPAYGEPAYRDAPAPEPAPRARVGLGTGRPASDGGYADGAAYPGGSYADTTYVEGEEEVVVNRYYYDDPDAYYVEDDYREGYRDGYTDSMDDYYDIDRYVGNRYGSWGYAPTYYDPFYDPFYWPAASWYGPRWRPGFAVQIGFGYGHFYNRPWHGYRPYPVAYVDPYWGHSGYYGGYSYHDPFFYGGPICVIDYRDYRDQYYDPAPYVSVSNRPRRPSRRPLDGPRAPGAQGDWDGRTGSGVALNGPRVPSTPTTAGGTAVRPTTLAPRPTTAAPRPTASSPRPTAVSPRPTADLPGRPPPRPVPPPHLRGRPRRCLLVPPRRPRVPRRTRPARRPRPVRAPRRPSATRRVQRRRSVRRRARRLRLVRKPRRVRAPRRRRAPTPVQHRARRRARSRRPASARARRRAPLRAGPPLRAPERRRRPLVGPFRPVGRLAHGHAAALASDHALQWQQPPVDALQRQQPSDHALGW